MRLEDMLTESGITEMEIMEYADGVLAPERRPVVRAALAKYPELMQLLETFIFTRGPLVEAYDEVLDAPIPGKILKVVRRPDEPLSFLDWLNPASWPRFKLRTPVFAVAALVAVTLVAWLMNFVVRYDYIPPDRQGVALPSVQQQALDATPMGASAGLAAQLSFEPQLTFYSRLKLWCREYGLVYGVVSSDNAAWQGGLACRGTDGVWRVRDVTAPLRLRADSKLVGEEALGILAHARDALRVGDVLGREAEADLIKNGWQRKP